MSKKASVEKIKKMFVEASIKLQNGDALGAKRGLEKAAKLAPSTVAIHHNLGIAYQHLDQHHKAIQCYERVLKLEPNNVEAMINLGLSQNAMEAADKAMKLAQDVLKVTPNHPRALNLIGTIYAQRGDPKEAAKLFEIALGVEPNDVDARFNLANATLQLDNAEAALKLLTPLLGEHPAKNHAELAAQILMDLKRFDEASSILADLKKVYPNDLDIEILDMSFCELIKDHFSVVDKVQDILKKTPKNARVWNTLGSAYFQLDSIENSIESYQKAINLDPQHAEYQNNIGLAYASLGDQETAESFYRKSIQLSPGYAEAYRNLVAMKKFKTIEDEDAKAVEAIWKISASDDFMRCKFAFALGKIYDDCGHYDQAFETYDIGNKLKSKEVTMDFDQYFSHIDRIMEVLKEKPKHSVLTNDSETQPIFILGMPRSGTTLVEQIISRHPEVTGCGELPCIERAIGRFEKRYGGGRVYPDDFLNLETDILQQETQEYFNWVARLHEIDTGYFTDKMPFNFVHVWLIKAMFPHAAIAHCHRHPLDVITSNYFQLYGSDINFVYNLEILAKYYVRYQRLMRHWHSIFDENLYRVDYENLVSNNEQETRKLIDQVGLEWNDQCLDQKRSGAAVRTASIWQVRQGIYTSSKERWRRYEKHLAPAIKILQAEKVLDEDYNYIS